MSDKDTDITYIDKDNNKITAKEINFNELFNYSFVRINSLSKRNLKLFNDNKVIKKINCRAFICKKVKGFYFLPHLPQAETIICHETSIRKVGNMPQVRGLFCISNKIERLPKCLQQVEILHCQNNKLNYLPMYLPKVKELNCSNNKITELPSLPSCEIINCSNNNIHYIPNFPKCRKIKLDNNPIIYYSLEYSKKMQISYPSPLEVIIDDFLLAKLFLTGLTNREDTEKGISLLWQEYFWTEEDLINHIIKVFNNLEKSNNHKKLNDVIKYYQLIKN